MKNIAETYHVPVLLKDSIDGLNVFPGGVYVDVTFGGGGHSEEILNRLNGKGHLYSFDQDADAERNIRWNDSCFTFIRSNFRYLKNWMRYYNVEKIDGLLADLGVSIASIIVKARKERSIVTTNDFLTIVEPLFRKEHEKKDMAKLFQALRIEVNHEMDALKEMLIGATELIRPGGRLSVITYHSLEDRIVKNVMKAGNVEGTVKQDFFGRIESTFVPVNNKVITPSKEEQENNPRSRSAKLRIAERK